MTGMTGNPQVLDLAETTKNGNKSPGETMKEDISPRGMSKGGQKRPIREMTIEGLMIIGGQKRPTKEVTTEGQMITGGQKRP